MMGGVREFPMLPVSNGKVQLSKSVLHMKIKPTPSTLSGKDRPFGTVHY